MTYRTTRSLLLLTTALILSVATACERKPATGDGAAGTGDIVIGMYGSLTGDGASFGQSSREGTEMAVRPGQRTREQETLRR